MEHDELITQFCSVTGASPTTAQSALASTNWNLEEAVTVFYASQDAPPEEEEDEDAEMADEDQVPRAVPSGAPRPAPAASSSSRSAKPPQNSSKLRTLKDLQGGDSAHDDDESDDEKQDFFAGGEKSGLAVQNPNKPTDHFKNILNQAKQNRERPGGEDEPAQSSNFAGRAQTLGGDDAPSQVVDDPSAVSQRPAALPRVERTLHLWQDGFSVDDGPLYRFDDPANAPTLALINQGRAPLALLGVQPGQEVDLALTPHKDEKYVQPKKAWKPFGGSGQRLGSPTPGAGSSASGESMAFTSSTSTAAPAAAAAAGTTSTPSVSIDESQPILTLQIRLGDGTRLQSRFNTTHTVGEVYDFVNASNTQSRTRGYALMTTFPSKELSDKSLVLGDMAEFKRGGVVVQKWT